MISFDTRRLPQICLRWPAEGCCRPGVGAPATVPNHGPTSLTAVDRAVHNLRLHRLPTDPIRLRNVDPEEAVMTTTMQEQSSAQSPVEGRPPVS
jgi:hypothetical protein